MDVQYRNLRRTRRPIALMHCLFINENGRRRQRLGRHASLLITAAICSATDRLRSARFLFEARLYRLHLRFRTYSICRGYVLRFRQLLHLFPKTGAIV